MIHDPQTLNIAHYQFLGGPLGAALPDLSETFAKHSKGDALGNKSARPALRQIPLSQFDHVQTTGQLCRRLFGQLRRVNNR